MTSATLSQNQSRKTFQKGKTGSWNVDGDILNSPLSSKTNENLMVKGLPQINNQNPLESLEASAQMMLRMIPRTRGGTRILFTSYTDLHYIKETLQMHLDPDQHPIMVQGEGELALSTGTRI